jgi:hypothetical protein
LRIPAHSFDASALRLPSHTRPHLKSPTIKWRAPCVHTTVATKVSAMRVQERLRRGQIGILFCALLRLLYFSFAGLQSDGEAPIVRLLLPAGAGGKRGRKPRQGGGTRLRVMRPAERAVCPTTRTYQTTHLLRTGFASSTRSATSRSGRWADRPPVPTGMR